MLKSIGIVAIGIVENFTAQVWHEVYLFPLYERMILLLKALKFVHNKILFLTINYNITSTSLNKIL